MIKAIVYMGVGAFLAYLYMNPGDVTGATDMLKSGINQGATIIQEATE
jgi:hypothetical protein|tara:strand:- start:293 stop:436 length:144 start_codon:yes stop_codon:yes gene_type:complete